MGGQLGVQMIISRSIVLDLFFLGPEVNSGKLSLVGKDISSNTGWSAADKQEIENELREFLNNVPLIGNRAEVNVDMDNKTVSTSYKGLVPGIRVGGSVGIRF